MRVIDTRDIDGRNIDPALGTLAGEGAQQHVEKVPAPLMPHDGADAPSQELRQQEGPSYYGAPLLKEPVWRWFIPAYFFVGGVAGAAAALGGAAQLSLGGGAAERRRLGTLRGEERLVRSCRMIATGGAVVSSALLIADLGKPTRFLNMMRVFRPTSPMNMGTWILSAFGMAAGASTAAHVLPLPRSVRRAGDAAASAAGVMGLPLCTYTGVLIANTAVPIWQGTRRSLPVLFAASGAAGAAGLLEAWPPGGRGDVVAHRFAVIGKTLEIALSDVFQREADAVPRVGRPLHSGVSAALWRASQALSVAGLAATLLSRRGSTTRRVAGALSVLGSLSMRFAVVRAGHASARDPHATSAQQRAGRGAQDVVTERDQAGASHPALRGEGASATLGQGEREHHA